MVECVPFIYLFYLYVIGLLCEIEKQLKFFQNALFDLWFVDDLVGVAETGSA